MSTTPSLATGAPLTPETWADFVTRLRHDCVGDGVDRHYTADALFTVEARKIDTGIDLEFADKKLVYREDSRWFSPLEFWEQADQDERNELSTMAANYGTEPCLFTELAAHAQWEMLGDMPGCTVTGWVERWEYVNAHLTRDAADAFIARKKHDYRQGIRVYVESQCYAWEFNAIKEAILSGRLVFSEKEEGTPI